jgi:alpha-galactosidase
MIEIARAMERLCPDALLLNFANPENKLCEAVRRLTSVKAVGLCHGVLGGLRQLAYILNRPVESLDASACGINHCTWFQTIRDRATGQDLYPLLRERALAGDPLAEWHELALGRVLLRHFGLWPSPGTNHYGEYIRWAQEFMSSEMHFYYDPADGAPWETGRIPEFVYYAGRVDTDRPWLAQASPETTHPEGDELALSASGELAVPLMEGIGCGQRRELDAVNVPNRGAIPELPDDLVVEIPAVADAQGLHPTQMAPLPEPVAALIRTQASIHKLVVEAYAERSKAKLLQAILIEPTVDSYRRAMAMMEEMLAQQSDLLPPLE